jgi:hypothetical protein
MDQETQELLVDQQLLSFYGWWEVVVCLFAFLGLMSIWYHIGKKKKDYGQVWLALSILCWCFSGIAEILISDKITYLIVNEVNPLDNTIFIPQYQFLLNGWRSIFSLFNSLFILLALPWFKYIPGKLEDIVKSKYWIIIIGLPFLFSLLPTLSKIISGKNIALINELDVYYAILTLIFLVYILFTSFIRRRLPMLAWLSVICIIITLVAQLYKIIGSPVDMILFSAIFKTCLIMIFFSLALSWVKELSENIIPPANQIFLELKQINSNGSITNQCILQGFPGAQKTIELSRSNYDILHKFVATRKIKPHDWLEIKPKNGPNNKVYDVNDHNQIKRLLNALLDGIFGKDSWSKNNHADPLKESLFEMSQKRERKIRLAIPESNIVLSDI